MDAKHVPGPWTVSHPAPHVWKIRDWNGSLIADYYGANSDENPQNEATARLIATAPALLSVCEVLHGLLDEGCELKAETIHQGKTIMAWLYDTMVAAGAIEGE